MSLLIHHMNAPDPSQAKHNLLRRSMLQGSDNPDASGFRSRMHPSVRAGLRVNPVTRADHGLVFAARMPHVWTA